MKGAAKRSFDGGSILLYRGGKAFGVVRVYFEQQGIFRFAQNDSLLRTFLDPETSSG